MSRVCPRLNPGRFLFIIIIIILPGISRAQDKCLSLDQVYSNLESAYNLLHGDFNGDALQDLVLTPRSGTGTIRIMHGSPLGLMLKDSITTESFYHVSAPADLTGDGYDDLLISSGNEIHFYTGNEDGLTENPGNTIFLKDFFGKQDDQLRGYAEPYADQNKNDKIEILITAGIGNDPGGNGGVFKILEWNTSAFETLHEYTEEQQQIFPNLPPRILGDMNGDGYVDFGMINWGYVEIYYGSASYFTTTTHSSVYDDFDYTASFSNAGDINGDGYNDLLITQAQFHMLYTSAWIFLGSDAGVSRNAAWITNSEHPFYDMYNGFGQYSGGVGDVNNDGYDDFFISGNKSIYSHIYFGSANLKDIQKGARFGYDFHQFLNAGDINGDGNDDYAMAYYNPEKKFWEIGVIKGTFSSVNLRECYISDQPVVMKFLAKFGQGAGDVNKDGFDDIVVGHDQLDPSNIDPSGRVEVITGAKVGIGSGGMIYGNQLGKYFGDQFGSGDFNGDGYSDVMAGEYTVQSVHLYYGSANGMKRFPDTSIKETGIYSGWGESIEDVGDLNGDGFDDFLSFGAKGMTLLLGAATGPRIFLGWNFPSFDAFRAGDSNKDGFTDFFLKVADGYVLFLGSRTGPIQSSFVSSLPVIFGGDINGDGFDDMLTSDSKNKSIGILFGNSTGYTEQKNIVSNAFNPNGIGDFNGDGFDDIGFSNTLDNEKFPGSPWRVDIYTGSASGIQATVYTTIRSKEKHQNLVAQPRIGDFNGDGFEDLLISAGLESWLIYGIKGISNITCPADAILYSDSSCSVSVSGFDPIGDPALYNYFVTGTIDMQGTGSLNGKKFATGEYVVTYSLISDENKFCISRIKVLDTLPPVLIVPEKLILCNNNSAVVKIPSLRIKDSCRIRSVNYVIFGTTFRIGTGTNASGILNPGESVIRWTVTDSSENISTIDLPVVVLKSNFYVKIPMVYQVSAQQSQANTIYLGYANNTLRLTAYEANSSKHKYLWSNGDTTRFTRVRHTMPGTYEYSVNVTNENGCSAMAYTTIQVVDNYCPNPIKDFITQYFPQLLDQPWIQALIASASQMYLCYNGSTVCVSPAEVPAMVASGARLGQCGRIYESNDMITAKKETNSVGVLTLSASPNPSNYEFTLKIDGTKGKPYALRIVNSTGSPVFMKQGLTENIVRAGAGFQKGVYFAEVICGNERRVIRLLKMR